MCELLPKQEERKHVTCGVITALGSQEGMKTYVTQNEERLAKRTKPREPNSKVGSGMKSLSKEFWRLRGIYRLLYHLDK